jgi:hypothetical protein
LEEVAAGFVWSAEFMKLYGATAVGGVGVSNADFLTKAYTNVLGRTPDPAGYAWWLDQLNTGKFTKITALMGMSESAENKAGVSAAIGAGIVMQMGLPAFEVPPSPM